MNFLTYQFHYTFCPTFSSDQHLLPSEENRQVPKPQTYTWIDESPTSTKKRKRITPQALLPAPKKAKTSFIPYLEIENQTINFCPHVISSQTFPSASSTQLTEKEIDQSPEKLNASLSSQKQKTRENSQRYREKSRIRGEQIQHHLMNLLELKNQIFPNHALDTNNLGLISKVNNFSKIIVKEFSKLKKDIEILEKENTQLKLFKYGNLNQNFLAKEYAPFSDAPLEYPRLNPTSEQLRPPTPPCFQRIEKRKTDTYTTVVFRSDSSTTSSKEQKTEKMLAKIASSKKYQVKVRDNKNKIKNSAINLINSYFRIFPKSELNIPNNCKPDVVITYLATLSQKLEKKHLKLNNKIQALKNENKELNPLFFSHPRSPEKHPSIDFIKDTTTSQPVYSSSFKPSLIVNKLACPPKNPIIASLSQKEKNRISAQNRRNNNQLRETQIEESLKLFLELQCRLFPNSDLEDKLAKLDAFSVLGTASKVLEEEFLKLIKTNLDLQNKNSLLRKKQYLKINRYDSIENLISQFVNGNYILLENLNFDQLFQKELKDQNELTNSEKNEKMNPTNTSFSSDYSIKIQEIESNLEISSHLKYQRKKQLMREQKEECIVNFLNLCSRLFLGNEPKNKPFHLHIPSALDNALKKLEIVVKKIKNEIQVLQKENESMT